MKNNHYKTILKSTSIVGGAQLIDILFRIIKNKLLSMLIGPTGMGLINTYQTALSLVTTAAGMGVGFSGVRQIAEAEASSDQEKIYKTALTLRRISILFGLLGVLICLFSSDYLSRFTFGSADYANPIRILSLFIFFEIVTSGQTALLQGTRRIADLARVTIWGSVFGLCVGVPLIYFFRYQGIVPLIILLAVVKMGTSWWYARKIRIEQTGISWRETLRLGTSFVQLGFAFMLSGFATMLAQYLIKVIAINKLGIEAVGIYMASNVISVLYIGIILDAMGKDYYPRLTGIIEKPAQVIQLINEQIEIGIALALPGLLATLTFAPLLVYFFYTAAFSQADDILRWQILGIYLRVISWPMAYYYVAKGKGKVFLLMEIIFAAAHVLLAWFGVLLFGLAGLGIAFCVLYIFYTAYNYVLLHHTIQFVWSAEVKNILTFSVFAIGITFLILLQAPPTTGYLTGAIATLGASWYTIKKLMVILEITELSQLVPLLKNKFRKHA